MSQSNHLRNRETIYISSACLAICEEVALVLHIAAARYIARMSGKSLAGARRLRLMQMVRSRAATGYDAHSTPRFDAAGASGAHELAAASRADISARTSSTITSHARYLVGYSMTRMTRAQDEGSSPV